MDFSKVKAFSIPEGNVKSVSIGGVVIWQAKTEQEQLTAPTIALDGDTLTMTATDSKTETFAILVDGVEMATGANSDIISFTIGGTTYQAIEGMTWAEWVASDYNTGSYYIDTDNGYEHITSDGTSAVASGDIYGTAVNDVIVSGVAYILEPYKPF